MGSLFRSEEMCIAQLFFQSEAAYACVSELGELGLVQFRDLNPDVSAFQRKFVNEVRRCDEMERKLRFLEKEIKKAGVNIFDSGEDPEAPPPREMIDLEATFEKLENEIKDVNVNQEALKRNFLELTELKHILRKTQSFFEEAELHHVQMHDPYLSEEVHSLLDEEGRHGSQPMRLGFVAGVISWERIPTFEKMLWRACHGNVFLRQAEIESPLEDPSTGGEVHKSVFIIFFQGDQLKSRVKKICEGFRATLYPCPETQSERREMALGVMTRIEDLQTVLGQTQEHRHRVLVSAARNIKIWFIKVGKIKAIYHTLNMFNLDVTQKCLIAECWCPVAELDTIQMGLRRGTERSGSSVPSILNRMETKEDPPTYNCTNKLTGAFQAMVDAYGVANYREVNPALFTIITFPFLFAVMFGDAGHGFLMSLFALWMVLSEKHFIGKYTDNEMWTTIFGGRYVILLMGLFSVYTGFVYNDVFSKSMNIFGSSWRIDKNFAPTDNILLQLDPNGNFSSPPYPYGIDPIWQLTENKITFLNSYKMKLSIILGVTHMVFGLFLSLVNYRYYKKTLNIFCDFIPQLIFMLSIFGYLVLLIFIKWFKCSVNNNDNPDLCGSGNAPSLLINLINMFLFKPIPEHQSVFKGQDGFQKFLVVVAVLCIPWMLCLKPIYLYLQHHNKLKQGLNISNAVRMVTDNGGEEMAEVIHNDQLSQSEYLDSNSKTNESEEEWDLSNICILQAIHVIEFCLGSISNTASYLRLWALSLAHAELSDVLWTMVMKTGLGMNTTYAGAIVLFGVFAFWAALTVFILLLMEGLSAFLHALRLHWVEFQNKFYVGSGYTFTPFSFKNAIESFKEE